MISTKHCDVCDVEFPPMVFVNTYECADVPLHKNHPDANFASVRITAHPVFTSPSCDKRVDICPDCFIRLTELLLRRVRNAKARSAKGLKEWQEWRQVTRKAEAVREGSNQRRSTKGS